MNIKFLTLNFTSFEMASGKIKKQAWRRYIKNQNREFQKVQASPEEAQEYRF
jgi:hypothetical protein